MMRLPWKQAQRQAEAPYAASATELRLKRYRDVPALVLDALRLRRSFASAEGAVAVGLAAAPLRRTFWTLTAWADAADIDRYYRDRDHAAVMRRFRGRLEHARSARWTTNEARPSWRDAFERLEDVPREGREGGA